jgi:hypothetical protein
MTACSSSSLRDDTLIRTFPVECAGLHNTATVSRFADGRVAEVFLQSSKPGSQSDVNARDPAVVRSIALQHGVPLETISQGAAAGSARRRQLVRMRFVNVSRRR